MIKYAKENIKAYGLENNITIEAGDCLEVLERLEEPIYAVVKPVFLLNI